MHPGRIEVAEPRLAFLGLALHEVQRRIAELFVHGFHALLWQRAGILNCLFSNFAELRVNRGVILVSCFATQHSTRPEFLSERRVFWVVVILRFFLSVEVIEIAEELVEAVDRRQELVSVSKMVLAELPGCVPELFQKLRDGGIFRRKTLLRSGQAHFRQPCSDWALSRDERRTASSATLLPVEVCKYRSFLPDAVDVRSAVSHDTHVVRTDIEPADVVRHDEENIRFL